MNLLQMAVCPTHALPEWSATALQMDPGTVVHAQQVSVEMVPYVMTWMRCKFCSLSLFSWCEFLLHVINFYLWLISSVIWCLMFATKSVEGSAVSTPIQVSTVYLVPSATRATSLSAWVWRLPRKTNRWTKHRKNEWLDAFDTTVLKKKIYSEWRQLQLACFHLA